MTASEPNGIATKGSDESSLQLQLAQSQHQAVHGMDVPWLLDQWADRCPGKPFLIWEPFEGEPATWTFSRLRSEARAFAAGLHRRGVSEGQFVLIHMDNCPEFLIAWFACAVLGAVAVSTNTRSVAGDLAYFRERTGATCAITQACYAKLIVDACPQLRLVVVSGQETSFPRDLPEGLEFVAFPELVDETSTPPLRKTDPLANLAVQFTSGTTSRPKAVLWTHANAIWSGMMSAAHMRLQQDDIALVVLPLFHTNALAYSMLTTLWCGSTMVLQPKFSASRFWAVSVKHKVTWLSTIPFTIKALAGKPVPANNYRFWALSAHHSDVTADFGIRTMGWWGMTETITQGIVTDINHPGPHMSMGRAAPEYAIRIVKENGEPAAPGERGRLFIRGVQGVSLFKEYYGDPAATRKAFDDNGWFDTGDVIAVSPEGYLFFGDRDKDLLRVGGENVAASEIEAVIVQSGLVEECAVVGKPHPMLDEVPVAFVVAKDGHSSSLRDGIMAYCAANLADFKIVREVHVMDRLPRGLMEKVQKNALRDWLMSTGDGPNPEAGLMMEATR